MAGNDIYNDRTGITSTSTTMRHNQARAFMKEVNKQPTHPTKQWVARDTKTSTRIYYNI